jgi:threonine dehydratase
LLSGTAVAAHGLKPGIQVIGAEPLGADDAWRSLKAGHIEPVAHPKTVADGLRATIGPLTFAVLKEQADEVVRVEEQDILDAMRYIWERMKIVIEPSSAVPIAALRRGLTPVKGRRAGIIVTGGNVDLDHLAWSAS